MKTFVITASKNYLAKHPRKGQPTGFKKKILEQVKIHTFRGNYKYWQNIVRQVNAGEAVLSLREWSGLPYKSKQQEIVKFTKLGIQKVKFRKNKGGNKVSIRFDAQKKSSITILNPVSVAKNDGFDQVNDFINWFPAKFDGCVLHFTDFRY